VNALQPQAAVAAMFEAKPTSSNSSKVTLPTTGSTATAVSAAAVAKPLVSRAVEHVVRTVGVLRDDKALIDVLSGSLSGMHFIQRLGPTAISNLKVHISNN
jgi:hypothetical protein